MTLQVVTFLAITVLAAGSAAVSFDEWKLTHNRVYLRQREEAFRRSIWLANMRFIDAFNANSSASPFHLAINEYGDLTHSEFKARFLGTILDASAVQRTGRPFVSPDNLVLPDAVDWRSKGLVTAVKDQGQCGSCWSFSATGALEGQVKAKTGTLVSLSEQNLIDCSRAEGNKGCDGGLMDQAFTYIRNNHGINSEASYPYTGSDGACRFNSSTVAATVSGFVDIAEGNESALQAAAATVGPVSVAIDASSPAFQFYKGGIYHSASCSSTQLDHGVLVVGYGTLEGADYWLVKNSWGTSWGLQGYVLMPRNKDNHCGIATAASYPTV